MRTTDIYLRDYVDKTESTTIHHRWAFLGATAALLGRRFYLPFGHWNIYPNMYLMLMGEPATRKSSAISIAEKLLRKTGYETIASGKTSAEKFLMDLAKISPDDKGSKKELQLHDLWQEDDSPHELMVIADEANNFFGLGNYNFISIMGELWDCKEEQPVRFKNSTSFVIKEPCVNILSGNTQTNFCLAFPPEIIGQGFFSRLLLIHADPSGRKITMPPPPPKDIEGILIDRLKKMYLTVTGEATLTPEAYEAIDYIYKNQPPLDDVRFSNYAGRRLTHMLKLCMLYTALELRTTIELEDVILANSTLTFAENRMPSALGEYGKGKHSEVTAKIISLLDKTTKPLTAKDIWSMGISSDLEKISQLGEILMGLKLADKVQDVQGGFMPKRKMARDKGKYLDFSQLLESERN